MAARRYFRKGDADLPSRGAFVYRGTQVVTGAEARQVKEEEARRRSAADDLLRPRPGTKPARRQAFDHGPEPEHDDRANRRSQARPAQAPSNRSDSRFQARPSPPPGDSKADEAAGADASTVRDLDPGLGRPADTVQREGAPLPNATDAPAQPADATGPAPRAADAARPSAASPGRNSAATGRQASAGPRTQRATQAVPDYSTASGDASMGASAIIGAVAALLVTTPIVLVGGVVLSRPIEPLFVAVVLVLAALSGGVAAAAWEAGRHRSRPE
jgi:hypothetical protein